MCTVQTFEKIGKFVIFNKKKDIYFFLKGVAKGF